MSKSKRTCRDTAIKPLTLDQLKPGESGVIQGYQEESTAFRRMAEMGLTPGVVVTMRKRAPFGDPLQIRLRGYELTLRSRQARRIPIQRIKGERE